MPPSGPSFGVGAGAGVVSCAGSLQVSVEGVGAASGEVEGSGPVFQAHGLVDLAPHSRASVVILAGYRSARASSVEVDGVSIQNAQGDDYNVDYSGLIVAAHLRLRLAAQ